MFFLVLVGVALVLVVVVAVAFFLGVVLFVFADLVDVAVDVDLASVITSNL